MAKEMTALRFDPALLKAMRDLTDREGIPMTRQFEMAARDWLKRKYGIVVPKTPRTRRKP